MASAAVTPSTALKRVPLILIGVGNVGQALLSQIQVSAELHATRYGMQFDVLAIADSTGCVQAVSVESAPAALTLQQITAALQLKEEKKGLRSHPLGSESTAMQLVSDVTSHTRCIVVDASAAEGTAEVLLLALQRGSAAVTANKKPMAGAQSLWDSMHAPALRHRLRYESTVGAGTPMVAALARVVASGDPVRQLQGTFSGTLGYVMSGLEAGKSYSGVIREAVQLGYTEPDPRDDLGGVDVARKALILARMLGWKADMSDVQVEPLYPPELAGLTVSAFLAALGSQDALYAEKIAQAKSDRYVMRYVANIQSGKISVGLMAVAADTPLGRLQGTENMLEIHTATFGMKPLVIQGAGAGGAVTAVGILADMVELATTL